MRTLLLELEALELDDEEKEEEESDCTPRVGDKVVITRNDKYFGKFGVVDGPYGKAGIYWNIRLDGSHSVIHKTTSGFKTICCSKR